MTVELAITRLEDLSAEMGRLGWPARLQVEAGRIPCLHVQNPEPGASALAEHIYAAPKEDGTWFWWSWADPISQDTAIAAQTICRALRSASTADF